MALLNGNSGIPLCFANNLHTTYLSFALKMTLQGEFGLSSCKWERWSSEVVIIIKQPLGRWWVKSTHCSSIYSVDTILLLVPQCRSTHHCLVIFLGHITGYAVSCSKSMHRFLDFITFMVSFYPESCFPNLGVNCQIFHPLAGYFTALYQNTGYLVYTTDRVKRKAFTIAYQSRHLNIPRRATRLWIPSFRKSSLSAHTPKCLKNISLASYLSKHSRTHSLVLTYLKHILTPSALSPESSAANSRWIQML